MDSNYNDNDMEFLRKQLEYIEKQDQRTSRMVWIIVIMFVALLVAVCLGFAYIKTKTGVALLGE